MGALPGVFVIEITAAQSETVSWSQAGPREGDLRREIMKEKALERSSGQSVCLSVCLSGRGLGGGGKRGLSSILGQATRQ